MDEEPLLFFVDIALLFILAELMVLGFLRFKGLGRMSIVDVIGHLSAGALLLLTLRALIRGWEMVAFACLLASFPAHLLDLQRRWRRPGKEVGQPADDRG
ncbi:MAG: hypothetical protein AAFZ18_10990 [Myxococcota bacterium]